MKLIIDNVEEGNILRITIISIKKWGEIIYLVFWLTFWTIIGGHGAIQTIGQGGIGEVEYIFVIWLMVWLGGGVLTIYHLLWLIVGKEEIEISSDSIAYRRTILGIGRFKVFSSEHISGIRIDTAARIEPYRFSEEGITLNKGTGMITFDYIGKTIRIGIGLNKSQARELVVMIHRLYPQYQV